MTALEYSASLPCSPVKGVSSVHFIGAGTETHRTEKPNAPPHSERMEELRFKLRPVRVYSFPLLVTPSHCLQNNISNRLPWKSGSIQLGEKFQMGRVLCPGSSPFPSTGSGLLHFFLLHRYSLATYKQVTFLGLSFPLCKMETVKMEQVHARKMNQPSIC